MLYFTLFNRGGKKTGAEGTSAPQIYHRGGGGGGGGGGGSPTQSILFFFQMLYISISTNAVYHMYDGVQNQLLGKSLFSIEKSV